MKILAAGDLHGDSKLSERLAEKAEKEKVDLVILCGDITHMDTSTENMIKPFVKRKEKVLLIPGNHDSQSTANFLAKFYDIKNIHGYSVKYEDVGIFGAGGANVGINQFTEKELYDLLEEGHKKINYLNKKIMVTHAHPSGTKIEKFTDFFKGSEGIRGAIEKFQPDFMLCSHVHEAHGIEEMIGKTKVINVGREGKIIEL